MKPARRNIKGKSAERPCQRAGIETARPVPTADCFKPDGHAPAIR